MGNISVLIVYDSSVMRKIVERSLRQAGIEIGQVYEAGNGLEALAVLNERSTWFFATSICRAWMVWNS
jgi:two-component system, chemotaxis family, chemotaxis protein CheY